MSCIHANLKGSFIKNELGDFFLYYDKNEFVDCLGDLSVRDIVFDPRSQMVFLCCSWDIIGAALDVFDFLDVYTHDLTPIEQNIWDHLMDIKVSELKVRCGYNCH